MQILLNGLLQGILYGVMGFAFALVYRTTGVFHLALGGSIALAPFLMLSALRHGVPILLSVLFAVVVSALVGVVVVNSVHKLLWRNSAPPAVHLIASLGCYLIIVQLIAIYWGNETQVFRSGIDTIWSFNGLTLAKAQVLGPIATLLSAFGLFIWMSRSNRGVEMRAMSDNPILTALLGRNVNVLRNLAFALSGALAAVASLSQAWDTGFDPQVGLKTVLLATVAMIIGGDKFYLAPLIGGILLGVLRAEVSWYGSARWEEAATFTLLALFLFLRPQGLFSKRARIEDNS